MKDNQIKSIYVKNSIMGMFNSINFSVNQLLRSADRHMGTSLLIPIQHEDDYTVIPVKVSVDGEYAYTVEEGIVTNMVAEGVYEQEYDFDESDAWRDKEMRV